MMELLKQDEKEEPPMYHREITLEDGRYMIFYTFGDQRPGPVEKRNDQGEDV
jgi:hypothetical protein